MRLGAEKFLIRYIGLVAIARIFYHCHYFGDTIAGGILGYLIALGFYEFEIVVPINLNQ